MTFSIEKKNPIKLVKSLEISPDKNKLKNIKK